MTEFPKEAGISRYGQPAEIAELLAFIGGSQVDDGCIGSNGRRRNKGHLTAAAARTNYYWGIALPVSKTARPGAPRSMIKHSRMQAWATRL